MKSTKAPKKPAQKRVLIVDDHPMMREGLAQLLQNMEGVENCGEAGNAHEALDQVGKLKPDLVLLDITMPGKSGLELIKDIHSMYPETMILVISMHDESLYAERVLRAGARGYVMKQEGGKKLIAAIEQVISGGIFVSEKMASRIVELFSAGRNDANTSPIERLTDREFEVFQLIGKGSDIHEIADQLHLSVKTVEVHRANIKQKLKLKSVPDLLRFAVRWVDSQQTAD
jgi:DNA-binding NarL/FixJ family response regulator